MGKVYAAVTSGDAENIALCRRYGVEFIEHPNAPLGEKWNAALSLAPKDERVMVLGSDDFVSAEWWAVSERSATHLLMPPTLAMWEPSSGRACILEGNPNGAKAFGAGRSLSPYLREKVGEMWPPMADRGLDTLSLQRCVGAGFKVVVGDIERVPVCDVKTETNIWAYGRGWWMSRSRQVSEEDASWMLSKKLRTALTWSLKA